MNLVQQMLQEQFPYNNLNKRIKDIFTRVLKGHIAVADYKIKKKYFRFKK